MAFGRSRVGLLVAVVVAAGAAGALALTRGGEAPSTPRAASDAGGADAAIAIDANVDADPLDRYRDRPGLLVEENYVLATIGQLSPEKERVTRDFVKSRLDSGDDWRPAVRAAMKWPPSIDADIRTEWATYAKSEIEWGRNRSLSPHDFAVKWADKHPPPPE